MLTQAGFENRGGKGSHRNFMHTKGLRVTISGKQGDEVKEATVISCIRKV